MDRDHKGVAMSHRVTYLLFAIAATLTGALILFDRTPPASSAAIADAIFPGLTPQNLREITLTSGEFQTVLSRQVSGWRSTCLERGQRVAEDFADGDRVLELASELMSLTPLGPPAAISTPNIWAGYGLGSMDKALGDSISVQYGASRCSLHVGKDAGDRQVYARKNDEQRLLVIDARLCRWLRSARDNPDFLRSTRCFHLLGERTPRRLIWQSSGQKVLLERKNGQWVVDGVRADNRTCDRLVQTMRRMRILAFDPAYTDLKDTDCILIGYEAEDSEEYIVIDARTPAGIGEDTTSRNAVRVFWDKGKREIACRYLIPSALLKDMPGRAEDFRARDLLASSPATAKRISRSGSKTWGIERMNRLWWAAGVEAFAGESEWWVTSPVFGRLDDKSVRGYLENLYSARAEAFAGDTSLPESLVLEFPPDHDPRHIEIRWSESPVDGSDLLPVQVKGESGVRLFSRAAVRELGQDYTAFYSRRADVFNFSRVFELLVMRPDRTYLIHKKDGKWRLAQPVAAPAEKDHVEDILRCCAWVMAEEVLGEKRLRGEYGCRDSPYRLHIRTQPDESGRTTFREIEVGKEVGDEHCAISISGFPLLYKVPIALKWALEKELACCDWLPEGLGLKDATSVAIIRAGRRFRRQGQGWFGEPTGEALPAAKAQELERRLAQIRIHKILDFAPASPYPIEPPLMTIHAEYPGRTITLKLARRQDRFVGVVTDRSEILQLENEAVAVLIQETE